MNLPLPTPGLLLTFLVVCEGLLMRKRLSGDASREADRGSLRLLMGVIGASVGLAWLVGHAVPQARFDALFGLGETAMLAIRVTGLALFVAGIVLRWYAMFHLGRLFTFDVAVAADHQVVDTGPYRLVRHPAYTGSLLSFVGLGIYAGNALALPVLLLPMAFAFARRIRVEEAALTSALGSRYADYAARTRRLVPFVY